MTSKQAAALHLAAARAADLGLPLNRHVTVHWQRAGVPDARAAAATGRLLVLIRDWLRKQGHRTAWLWARENSDRAGSHVHVAIHIPAGVPWSFHRLRRWIERITGRPYLAGAVRTTRIGGTVNAATSSPGHYAANLARVLAYVTKAARDDGGPVTGKRCGFSQNLGRAAARNFATPARRRARI